jgi:8-oxo-dGTP diphosphatase
MGNFKVQVVVVTAFIEKQGKFLIIQRSANDTRSGSWETPGGGLEWGEDPIEGIVREVKEECGLDVTVTKPLKIFSWTSRKGYANRHMIEAVFECIMLDETQEVTLSFEHSAYKWVEVSELKDTNISFFLESLSPKT